MVLRGIFLLRKKEIDWFYEGGAAAIYPDGIEFSFLLFSGALNLPCVIRFTFNDLKRFDLFDIWNYVAALYYPIFF